MPRQKWRGFSFARERVAEHTTPLNLKGNEMSAVDLQRRLTRAMERGRGSMMITQSDLGVLLESGAYEAVCIAATAELRRKRGLDSQDQPVAESG